jgi:erythromycin esterase-like protein
VPATYDPVTGMLTPTTPLADGAHSITTTLTDAAGNESPQSAALPLTVDTAAPAAPTGVTVTDDVAPVTGAIAANGASNDNKPTFAGAAGSAEAGSTITVMDGATVLGTAVVAADGSWSVTPTTALADGAHSITTRATDAAGNVSPVSPALALTVDTAAPAAPAAPTSTAPSTNDNTPGIHIGVGLTDTPSLYVDGVKVPATYDPVTGMLTPTTPLGDGVHQFTTTLTDAAGNESPQSAALPLTVDTAAPAAPTGVTVTDDVAPVTGAIAANGASNDNKPTFAGAAGSAEAGSTITVMDGATVRHGSGGGRRLVERHADDGTGRWRAFYHHEGDRRGRQREPGQPALALTVDTAAPAAPAAPTSTAPSTNDNTPGIHIGVGLTDTPSLYVDGVKVPATYDPVTGMLTPTTPLADGAHSITTTLTDAAGNESPQSAALPLTVDTAAPAAPTGVTVTDDVAPVTGAIAANGASNDNKPTFAGAAGSAEAGSTITVMDGATVLGTAVVAADGSWSVTPTTALADGAHSITTRATDAAGNVSPVSPALALTVDTAAPAAPAAPTSTAPSTNDNTPGIHIGVGLTDTPSLYVDGVKVPATYDPVTGMLTPTTPLADGAFYHHDADRRGWQRKSPKRGPATDGRHRRASCTHWRDGNGRRCSGDRRNCRQRRQQRQQADLCRCGGFRGSRFHHYRDGWCDRPGHGSGGGRRLVERHADDGTGRWRAFYHHEGDRRGRQREPGQPRAGADGGHRRARRPGCPDQHGAEHQRQHPGHPYRGRPDRHAEPVRRWRQGAGNL